MKLSLFDFIDETLEYYDHRIPAFQYAQSQLLSVFRTVLNEHTDSVINLSTRIKKPESLKEKLIRNEFYLTYDTAEEAIEHLSDLVGITVQCRFIRNEAEIYKSLFQCFHDAGDGIYHCDSDPDVCLNLHMPQPQLQRNGFTIYRLDGYYLFNETKINFELQIKSLVHVFWNEIEHEVVYKNPDFLMYDQFNRSMLGAIRDNLDVVDRQLEIMYKEISEESQQAQIGMNEQGFKAFITSSINELVNRKMKESVGFTTDFKKCSATISQYIFLHDFVNGDRSRDKMIDYMETLSLLKENKLDFSEQIRLDRRYNLGDPFCDVLENYWYREANHNFQWHVFFVMLFCLIPGDPDEILHDFCRTIKQILIPNYWLEMRFTGWQDDLRKQVLDLFMSTLAESLVSVDTIKIIHEDSLYKVMNQFQNYVERMERRYTYPQDLLHEKEVIRQDLYHQISINFR